MRVQNKIEIQLSIEDIEKIVYEKLKQTYGEGEYSFDFKVINKPYPCGMYDSCDKHEFDSLKIVITNQR